jgi:molecular chaperone DnaK
VVPVAFAVGIDLGTTNTVVAAVRDGMASTLPDARGERLLASVVAIEPGGAVVVGHDALDQRGTNAQNTVYSVKRLIGRPWSTPEVQKARGTLPFQLKEGPKGAALVVAGGDTFTLPEISAFVLRQAKAIAEEALGSPVERAVITVPANFNDLQRAATKTAGRLAGLEVLRILNEPTAAALAYGPQGGAQERVAVYDLGGGTFDVTVLDLVGNVFEVLATAGDTALGGEDIDLLIAERMADDLQKKHRFDARKNPAAFSRLRILAESMKRELSSRDEYAVAGDESGLSLVGAPSAWRFRMTRPELEWASLPLVDRTLAVCQQALDAAGAAVREVDRILLVGGATRMPLVARKVEQFFGRAPSVRINPDEVVALGAAIQAELLDRSRKRAPGPQVHPQISPDSVVQPLPLEPLAGDALDIPNLPVVGPGMTLQLPRTEAPPIRPSAPAVTPTAMPAATSPVTPPLTPTLTKRAPPPVPPKPPLPAPAATATSAAPAVPSLAPSAFLPGRAASTLVFDVPEAKAKTPAGRVPEPAHRAPEPAHRAPEPAHRAPEPAHRAPEPAAAPPEPVGTAGPELDLDGPTRIRKAPIEIAPGSDFPSVLSLDRGPAAMPVSLDRGPAAAPAVQAKRAPPSEAAPPPRKAPLLIDVTPLSLNVETVGGFCDVLIDANTPVPCDRTRAFATASDGQTTVCVRVAQGESRRFSENTFLGEVELSGVTAAPRGEAPIAVTFEIDADGILNVRARDVKTGRETAARIQLAGTDSNPAEVEAMRERQAKHPLASLLRSIGR